MQSNFLSDHFMILCPWMRSLIWLSGSTIECGRDVERQQAARDPASLSRLLAFLQIFDLLSVHLQIPSTHLAFPGEEEPMQLGQPRLTPQERQRRLTLRLCIYCGKKGHFFTHCPEVPKWMGSSAG